MNSLQEIIEVEALANLLIQRGERMKKVATQARKKLEGVSTPSSARKGVDTAAAVNRALLRRQKFFISKGATV